MRRGAAHSTGSVDPAILAARTVGRAGALKRLAGDLESAARSRNRPHSLIVGPRGSGKTHLMSVAIHEAMARGLGEELEVLRLEEDATGIATYEDLLVQLGRRAKAIGAAGSDLGMRMLEARHARDPATLESLVADACAGRAPVLMVENLDRVFRQIGDEGQKRLRAFCTEREAMVIASTPLLFDAVSDRDLPWYGSFRTEHLDHLSVGEGRALLERIADADAGDELRAFLGGPDVEQRLRALTTLTGGSPRLWVIMARFASAEHVDELASLVYDMLDDLAPYYKARLEELSPTEQKLIGELCWTLERDTAGSLARARVGIRTATELAERTGVEQKVAANALRRLLVARWVRQPRMPAGTDARASYYEIREPLLRHHLGLREATGDPLPALIEFLRDWFTAPELRRRLSLGVTDGSPPDRHLALIREQIGPPPRGDSVYADGELTTLLERSLQLLVRREFGGTNSTMTEASLHVVAAAAMGAIEAEGLESNVRLTPPDNLKPMTDLARGAAKRRPEIAGANLGAAAARVVMGLDSVLAIDRLEARDRKALTLVAGGWIGACGDPAGAAARLESVDPGLGAPDRLDLVIALERAYFSAVLDPSGAAVAGIDALVDRFVASLGPEDRDTFVARSILACFTGESGDPARAAALYAELVADTTRVLGSEDHDTLIARSGLARFTGESGDPARAAAVYAELVADTTRVLGSEDHDTLIARSGLALFTGESGDPARAAALYAELVADRTRILGPEDPDTLIARSNLAHFTGESGDPARAAALYAELVADTTRVLGPEDQLVSISRRRSLAFGRAAIAGALGADRPGAELLAVAGALAGTRIGDLAAAALAAVSGSPGAFRALPSEERSLIEPLLTDYLS